MERIGRYLDLLLKVLVTKLKLYVKDTCDVLQKNDNLKIEGDLWLVRIDGESLYTSIPHICGLQAIEFFLENHYPEMGPQNEFLFGATVIRFGE